MNDIEVKIIKEGYQRNGVGGEPFYWIVHTVSDEPKKLFYSTFTKNITDDEQEEVNTTSVRTLEIGNPYSSWRGDRIGVAIGVAINKAKQIYPTNAEINNILYHFGVLKEARQ